MGRSVLFDSVRRAWRAALYLERKQLPTREGLELLREQSRRSFLKSLTLAAAAPPVLKSVKVGEPDVAIVGAGLAGLACADALLRRGVKASLYEASSRAGGRCWSLRGFFPGQVAERGGELIDNLHKTMIGYARKFGLTLEDVGKAPGEVEYYFDGQHVPEASVVEEFRALVPAMHADLRASSKTPTALSYNAADLALDFTDLATYLRTRGAGRIAAKAIDAAYTIEYGLEIDEQSCLNFLLFIHADRRSKFTPFGVFSDERYHVVGGNDQIAAGLAARLPGQISFGMYLDAVRKTPAGRIELHFANGEARVHDVVVLTLPFSVLRHVALDSSLGLPPWKTNAIQMLGYGTNAKMMVGFGARPWTAQGSNGSSYSDLDNLQSTWETNPSNANSGRAVITDYTGGDLGARLNPLQTQAEAELFLTDLDRVYPGSLASATRIGGGYQAHIEPWPSNPLTLGSYTCYRVGQFTAIAGLEATSVGNLLFAGEHTNSFYEWQGFMEGACLSGIAAAQQIL